MKTKLFLIAWMIIISNFIIAQNTFKHKRITVFKDGTSFIEKELSTATKNKSILFKELPFSKSESGFVDKDQRIVLGTLRFLAPNNKIIESVVTRNNEDSSKREREYGSISELLSLNKGKKVKITLLPDNKQVETFIDFPKDNLLITKNDNNFSIIPIDKISTIQFMDKPETKIQNFVYDDELVYMELKLEHDSKDQLINASYIQKGLSWFPAYFIELKENRKGTLSLEANLINDIEDFENADINFAVGIPSFPFQNIPEPLVSENTIWETLSLLDDQQLNQFSHGIQTNMMTQQRVSYNEEPEEDDQVSEGTGAEDFYFYKKQNVGLKKDGRLKTQLFTMDFDFEDLYSCTLEQNTTNNSYNNKAKSNQIWHSVRFKNTSSHPLTTGTVFFKKEDKNQLALISQNQLEYTPINEYATAKMAIAPDIMVSAKDIEIERVEIDNDNLLTINGETNIVNYKKFDIDIIIERKIIGTMISCDVDWKVSSNLDYYNSKNQSNQVSWKLKVPAGKTVSIKYKYKILVD